MRNLIIISILILFGVLLWVGLPRLNHRGQNPPPIGSTAKVAAEKTAAQQLPAVLGCDWGTVFYSKDRIDLTQLQPAGIDTVLLGINVGWHGAMRASKGKKSANLPFWERSTFWNGRDSYDPESVREILDLASRQFPQGKIILWLQIDTYPEWVAEHPEEALRNDKGEGFVVGFHFERAGNDPDPAKGEVQAWSFYSQKLREDLQKMLGEFVKTVESSKGGDQVVGYLIAGAQDGQFYLWDGPNGVKVGDPRAWSDYSKPAIRAWHQWLQRKYASPAALSAAWKQDVRSFDEAEPPAAGSLIGAPGFHDPATEVRQRNWKEFIAEGRVALAEDIARMLHKSASHPVIVGTSSGDNGARSNMAANVRLMHSDQIDFVNGPVRYGQRLAPASAGGALAATDSFRLNGKPIIFDLDYRTWMNKKYDKKITATGYALSGRQVGRVTTPEELRNAWLREAGRIAIGGHSVFLDPLEGPETFQDPSIQREMASLTSALSGVNSTAGASCADVAVIYDERATDWLKGSLAELHYLWSSDQRAELDLSGVPYGYYYLDDFKAGKVPPAKLYIFTNLLEIDGATAAAIEKAKAGNAHLCFLQGTGFNLDPARLSQIMGLDVIRAATAKASADAPAAASPLIPGSPPPTFTLPEDWTVFGPFPAGAAFDDTKIPLTIPAQIESAGIARPAQPVRRLRGMLSFSRLGTMKKEEVAWAFTMIDSPEERDVLVGAGADWGMTWFLNGEKVFDTSESGNEYGRISSDNFLFPLKLRKGPNVLAVRAQSGNRGLRLAVESADEIRQSPMKAELEGLKLDQQIGLVVQDPKARCLANYPQTAFCGFATREHGGWASTFAGTHVLRRSTIAALAEQAGAWRVAPPQYVVAANQDFLMLHPQMSGEVRISLKEPAALTEANGRLPAQPPAKEHLLNLQACQTYFFRLGDNPKPPDNARMDNLAPGEK